MGVGGSESGVAAHIGKLKMATTLVRNIIIFENSETGP
jgi:hypothetical protein